jgi:hypothetical protein
MEGFLSENNMLMEHAMVVNSRPIVQALIVLQGASLYHPVSMYIIEGSQHLLVIIANSSRNFGIW